MIDDLVNLYREVAEIRRTLANMIKTGTVAEVNKRGYRVQFGTDDQGKPILSPWYPHPENGGEFKTLFPLSKGQTVTALNPMGDKAQGSIYRSGGFSNEYPAPSLEEGENGVTFGKFKLRLSGEDLEVVQGDQSLRFKSDGTVVVQAGSKIILDAFVEMPKGFTVGGGSGVVATINGKIHSKQDITSETKIAAPIIQGRVTG